MAYRFAICDDCAADSAYIAQLLRRWAQDNALDAAVENFASAESFLFRYAEEKAFDVLLLDIEMGGMDGVTMARRIRQDNEAVQIVFITGYSDYIAEGYEVAALHYLMKPVSEEKLFEVLGRAVARRRRDERMLTLDLGGEMARIPLYTVRYLDVEKNYVTVHAREAYTVRRTLAEFEPLLDERFLRVGRSLIVNLTQIARVTRAVVTLADGTSLPLPRGAYEQLNRAIIART